MNERDYEGSLRRRLGGREDVGVREAELRMEPEELEQMIDEAQWRATTYLAPHEYVLSRDYPELHAAVKEHLLHHGYTGRFLDREYAYTNIGAYRYWVVGGVLNRARLDTPTKH